MTTACAITKNITCPLYEAVSGGRILGKLRELEASQWRSRAELEVLQLKRLRQLLSYAYENAPYYKRVFDEQGLSLQSIRALEDFRRVPFLTKEVIQERKDGLVSKTYPPDQLISNHTGGSTGKPLQFYQDRQQWDYGSAAKLRCNRWAGSGLGLAIILPHLRKLTHNIPDKNSSWLEMVPRKRIRGIL